MERQSPGQRGRDRIGGRGAGVRGAVPIGMEFAGVGEDRSGPTARLTDDASEQR